MAAALRYARDLEAFLSHVPADGAMVDCDAGRGDYTSRLLRLERLVYAYDYRVEHGGLLPSGLKPIASIDHHAPIAHRTCAGVWASHTLQSVPRASFVQNLAVFVDWLTPGGIVAFCLRQGEGEKRVEEQSIAGTTTRTIVLYAPAEVELLVRQCGLRTLDAWLGGSVEARTLHVIAQKV